MEVTQGERTATLADTTDHWLSDDDSFALWLNTSFPPAGREVPALVEDLLHHGLTVDGQAPYEEVTLARLEALIDSVPPLTEDNILHHDDGTWSAKQTSE